MNDFVHIEDFGASPLIPDNYTQIQAAIDYAITNKIPEVKFGYGHYKGSKALVVAKFNGTNFSFFGLKISGPKMTYSTFDSTVYEVTGVDQSGILVQWAKGFELENICFKGQNATTSVDLEIYSGKREYFVSGANTWGLAIDPFHANAAKLPGLEHYYVNTGSTGSTYVTIRGCSFMNFADSINLSPSGTSNGECILIEDCWTGFNYSALVVNQGQNKAITVRRLNQWTPSHTLINVLGSGYPPSIKDCNFAGAQYQFINCSTNWGLLKVENIDTERLYRIGNIGNGWTPSKFEHCRFRLQNDYPKSNCVFFGSAFFDSCQIVYYDTKKNILPAWVMSNLNFKNTILSSPIHPHGFGANYTQYQQDNITYEKETALYGWHTKYFTNYLNWAPKEMVTLTRVNNTYQFASNKIYPVGEVLVAVFLAPIELDNGKTSWSSPIGISEGGPHGIVNVGRVVNIGQFETLNVQIGVLS